MMTVALQSSPQAMQLLRTLGLDPQQMMRHLAGIQNHAGGLHSMIDKFARSSGMTPNKLQHMLARGIVPPRHLASKPNAAACGCQGQYAKPQTIDFGAMPGNPPANSPMALKNRRNAMKIERLINTNPAAKQALESRLGGRILKDGRNDGVLRVMRQPFGKMARGAPHAANIAGHSLGGIARGASSMGAQNPFGPGAYNAMMTGALANTLGHHHHAPGIHRGPMPQRRLFSVNPYERRPGALPGAGGLPMGGGFGGGGIPMAGGFGGGGIPMGGGGGMPMGGIPGLGGGGGLGGGIPGLGGGLPMGGGLPGMGGGLPMGGGVPGMGGAGGGSPTSSGGLGDALNAPGLTMEDKVVMLLMQITKGFDKKIQEQADHVNKLQQQQKGGKGGGGKGGGGSKSIDVETMKLKRLIDKRGQMFDMLRQVIDKYNETAKNMIQAIGR